MCPVDYVLSDTSVMFLQKQTKLPEHRTDISVTPKPGRPSFVTARDVMLRILYIDHPCLRQMLAIWHAGYR